MMLIKVVVIFLSFVVLPYSILANVVEQRDKQSNTTIISFELDDNRIFLNTYVNGSGPYKFMLDTCGHNIIDIALAKKLQLKLHYKGTIAGAGNKRVKYYQSEAQSIKLKTEELKNKKILVLALHPIKEAIGLKRLDGMLGFDFLQENLIHINYDKMILTLSPHKRYQLEDHQKNIIPIEIINKKPVVSGFIDKIKTNFYVDTGDRSNLTLFVPFIKKNKLMQRYKPKTKAITGFGLGGPIPSYIVKTGLLRIDKTRFENFDTRFPILEKGMFATSRMGGSIGNGLFKTYNVTIDYYNKKLILQKNKLSIQNYNDSKTRSGLWMVKLP